jgi:hypothetical protein
VLQDDRVYIGGDQNTTVISIADPMNPELLGTIEGLAGRLSFPQKNLMFSNAVAWNDQQSVVGGLRAATFARIAHMAAPPPAVTRTLPSNPTGDVEETLQDVPLIVQILPRPGPNETGNASVQVSESGGTGSTVLQFVYDGVKYVARLAKGFQKQAGSAVTALANFVVGGEAISTTQPLKMGSVRLLVDANNDTKVNHDDELPQRQGKPWAFWEADRNNVSNENALQDLATIKLILKVPVDNLLVSLKGDRATKWTLMQKALAKPETDPDGKAYLSTRDVAKNQLAVLKGPCAEIATDYIGSCPSQDQEVFLQRLSAGEHEFLVRCEECPTDPARMLRIELQDLSTRTSTLLDAAKTDIRPLQNWVSIYSARQDPSYSPSRSFVPLNGWFDIPRTAKYLTVLVHGFAVDQTAAVESFIPTNVKRLYWVGHPVLDSQQTADGLSPHVLGVLWPGDQQGMVPFSFAAYFPEDEFHAMQTGVPLANLLTNDFIRYAEDGTARRIDVVAHSLGNMVVNSALMWMPAGIVNNYVMNEAALPAEAFQEDYQYSPLERAALFPHAIAYGFSEQSESLDKVWRDDWTTTMQQPRHITQGAEIIDLPSLASLWHDRVAAQWGSNKPPLYEKRWSQTNRPYPLPAMETDLEPHRGPWRGFFARNLEKVRTLTNTFNPTDQALRIDKPYQLMLDVVNGQVPQQIYAWYLNQRFQKPDVGLIGAEADNDLTQFWATLGIKLNDEEYLWGGTTDKHFNITRQWAELAHWFPSRSEAAGTNRLAVATDNRSFHDFGGDDSDDILAIQNQLSHTYMTYRKVWEVWKGFEQYRDALK